MKHGLTFTIIGALSAVLILLLLLLLSSTPAAATQTFIVNSAADVPDADPGDGVCETGSGNGVCTLRAAVMEANTFIQHTIVLQANTTYLLDRPGPGDANG